MSCALARLAPWPFLLSALLVVLPPRAPLAAQTPDLESCEAPLAAFGDAGLPEAIVEVIDVAEDLAFAEAQVHTDFAHAFIGDITVTVTSPAGESVTLHAEGGGDEDDLIVTWSDLGVPYGTASFQCDCAMQPAGPGALIDFTGVSSLGAWTLDAVDSFPTSGGGTLDEWCVRLFLVAPPLPVADLACVEVGPGIAEVTWTNGADYDEVAIQVHNENVATLAGPFLAGDSAAFTTPAQPLPQLATISVLPATVVAGSGPPRTCNVALPAAPAAAMEIAPAARISGLLPPYVASFFFTDALVLADVQVDIEVTHPFIGGLDVSVSSPAGTAVNVHDGAGGFSANIDATYWDIGLPNGAPYDCACFMQPSGPGRLVDFAGEPIAGVWVVAVIPSLDDAGTVDLVGIAGFDLGPAFPIEDLQCAEGPALGTVEATWTHAADYSAVNVYVNGELAEVQLGPFTAGTTGEFVTAPQPLPSRVDVGIEGEMEDAPGPVVLCSAVVFIDAVADLACTSEGGTGVATATWTNTVAYDEINVYLDGTFAAALPGTDEAYSTPVLATGEAVEICVEGVLTGFGVAAVRCCRALLLGDAAAEACATPLLAVPGTFTATVAEIEVLDVITIEHAEVVLDLATGFVGDWDIVLASPEATVVQLHDNGGGAGVDLFLLFDDAGVANGSVPYDCACAVAPSGPGTLSDFTGELSDGTWSLTLTTFTAGTLQDWCVRLDGCALLPPGDVVCATSGGAVAITWVNSEPYDGIEVYENGALVATLSGDATGYIETNVAVAGYLYRIAGVSTALGCSAASDPCRAAVGYVEHCNSGVEIAAAAPGPSDVLDFPEAIIIGDVQVLLHMPVAFTSDFDVLLSSPFGTEVQLHDNGGGIGGFHVVWSDGGAENTGVAGIYDCDLCEMTPSGPGALADFAGEIAAGDWTLSFGGFSNSGTISTWCVDVAPGCAVLPPEGVQCESAGGDVAIEWSNRDDYASIEIERNGALLAVLAGAAASFTDVAPLAGPYSYRVFGIGIEVGCSSGSAPCAVDHRLLSFCDSASLALPTAAESSAEIEVADAIPIQDVEVFVDLTVGFVADITEIAVASPAATSVTLFDATFGAGANFDVTFSGAGEAANAETPLDCGGCRILPSGPGSLADFESEEAAGPWELTVNAGPFAGGAVLDEWCVGIFEGCAAAPPAGLACVQAEANIELAWTNGEAYDAIVILRNDLPVATLAGTATSYTDPAPPPARYFYRVTGVLAALDCGSRSETCGIALGRADTCATPALLVLGDGLPHEHVIEVSAEDEVAIAELEVFVEIQTGFAGNWDDISVQSPAATAVQVQDGGGGFTANFDVTYSDLGAPNTGQAGIYDCGGCLIRPSGPGELRDFAGESAAGSWTLVMTTAELGVLTECCIGVFPAAPASPAFLRGDVNGDGIVNALLDALYLLDYQFGSGPEPPCRTAADVNGDNVEAAILDALVLLGWQFNGAPPPPPPGPDLCGPDPEGAADPLLCAVPPASCDP